MSDRNIMTDAIEVPFTTSTAVKVTKSHVQFGPLKFYRLSAIPPDTFGRNGDLAVIDNTAISSEDVTSSVEPTAIGFYQKVPVNIPTSTVVYSTPLGGATVNIADGFDLNGTTITFTGTDLITTAADISLAMALATPVVSVTANPTVSQGVTNGTYVFGIDVLNINGSIVPLTNISGNAAGAASDINLAAVSGIVASTIGTSLVLTAIDGRPIIVTDNIGSASTTLGPFTTTGGNLTFVETVGNTGLTFTSYVGTAEADLNFPVDQPASSNIIAGSWLPVGLTNVLGIKEEGVDVGVSPVDCLNFIGAQVTALDSGTPGQVNIVVNSVNTYLSHWNTNDGTNGPQDVTESALNITNTYISEPTAPSVPFQDTMSGAIDRASNTATWTFTTPNETTGYGGDSTMLVEVLDGVGAVLYTGTTAFLAGDGVFAAGANATVTVAGSSPDGAGPELAATVSVSISMGAILPNSGPASIRITHTPNSAASNPIVGPFVYDQLITVGHGLVFFDNGTTPPINAPTPVIAENTRVTKYLSGLQYYTINSTFNLTASGINNLNRDTIATIANGGAVRITGSEYALPTINRSPFGAGSTIANFDAGTYTDTFDDSPVVYVETAWTVSTLNVRYIGPTGNVSVIVADAWNNAVATNTANDEILVDTFPSSSTELFEDFDDEDRRQLDGTHNGGGFGGDWISTVPLIAGQAQVIAGQLLVPDAATFSRPDGANSSNSNWTNYEPSLPAPNPDYTGLIAPVSYFRTWEDNIAIPFSKTNFTMRFTGTFAAGDALADLVAGNLEVYIRRIQSPTGNVGVGAPPLRLHLPLGFYDDGATIAGSGIRLGSSVANDIDGTYGGDACELGMFMELVIINPATMIDSIEVFLR